MKLFMLWFSTIFLFLIPLGVTERFEGDYDDDFQFVQFKSNKFIISEAIQLAKIERNFTQILDHFNPWDGRTWNQRYFIEDGYYKSGGPVFICIGGEWKIYSTSDLYNTLMYDLAKQYNAMVVVLEHRFYGTSQPTSDMTLENMKYLTTRQALGDLANFIVNLTSNNKCLTNANVVVFGGSYAGNLAAWFRLKYPHIAVGAIAYSAPLQAKLNFYGYFESAQNSYTNFDAQCLRNIETVFNYFVKAYDAKNYAILNKIIRPCTAIDGTVPLNRLSLLYTLMRRPFAGPQWGNKTMHKTCKAFNNMHATLLGDPVDIHLFAEQFHNYYYYKYYPCFVYDFTKSICEAENVMSMTGSRSWYYQKCTEFGYFKTTDAVGDQAGQFLPLSFYETEICRRVFGINFTMTEKHVQTTNLWYGGNENFEGTNVIFTNGGQDPWHTLSVLPSHNKTNVISILDSGKNKSVCTTFNKEIQKLWIQLFASTPPIKK